jgi:hypothetical protein
MNHTFKMAYRGSAFTGVLRPAITPRSQKNCPAAFGASNV